jgi:hypothetical protein
MEYEVTGMGTLFEMAIVQKRNVLNELRSSNMTVQELRFFSIYLSMINSRDVSTREVRFRMEDFQRIMGFGRLNIKQICESTDRLLTKVVHIPNENGGFTSFTLFRRCRVDRDENHQWFVEINASDDALPLMFDFKDKYFKYALWNALRLKSPNQVRMYEILKQYENLGKRELPVAELRDLLGIDDNEYGGRTGWSDFKKYVLDSCQKALREFTDISYHYKRGMTGAGGKWLSVIFYIRKNESYKDPLSLDQFIDMQSDSQIPEDAGASEPNAVPGEPEEEKWKRIYGSKRLSLLASACAYEFQKPQMEQILIVLTRTHIPADELTGSILWGKYRYLSEKYAALNAEALHKSQDGQKPIQNRFKYFLSMLEEETFQPAAYKES